MTGRRQSCPCGPLAFPLVVDPLCTVHGNRAPEAGRSRSWKDVRAEMVERGLVDEEAVSHHRERAEQEIAAGRDSTCNRGGEDLPCTCYQGPDFQQMTREELERAAERWRQRAIAAESTNEREAR